MRQNGGEVKQAYNPFFKIQCLLIQFSFGSLAVLTTESNALLNLFCRNDLGMTFRVCIFVIDRVLCFFLLWGR